MIFQEFPKMKYHKDHPAKIIKSHEEEARLGLEWVDSPADTHKPFELKAEEPKAAKIEEPKIEWPQAEAAPAEDKKSEEKPKKAEKAPKAEDYGFEEALKEQPKKR